MNFDDDEGGGRASPAAGLQHRAPVSTLVVHRFAAMNSLISQNFKLNLFIFAQASEGSLRVAPLRVLTGLM